MTRIAALIGLCAPLGTGIGTRLGARVVISLVIGVGVGLGGVATAQLEGVVPIRSIDPADADHADLQPIAEAIGDARVVAIGEASHGDGAAHMAAARLRRFLRQRPGFGVVAMEVGLYEGHAMNAALESGRDVRDIGPLGMPAFWRASGYASLVIEDAWGSYFDDAPLEIAGFAPEQTAGASIRKWPRELVELLRGVEGVEIDAARTLGLMDRLTSAAESGNLEALLAVRDELAALADALDAHAEAIAATHGERALGLWRRSIGDRIWSVDRALVADLEPAGELASYNERSHRMAGHLLWLTREVYPDRKLLVRCAAWHLLTAPEHISCAPRASAIEGARTVGERLRETLGDDLYTIAVTAAGGETGWAGGDAVPRPHAPEGSLEGLLSAAGHALAFVDLSSLPRGHPLRQRVVSCLAGATLAMRRHGDADLRLRADWGEQVDGVLFVRRMFPAPREPSPPDGAVVTVEGET